MGKKKVAVSLRKPPSVDPRAVDSFVAGDVAGNEDSSIAFASGSGFVAGSKVKSVAVSPRGAGEGIEARVSVGAAHDDTPLPTSEVRLADASSDERPVDTSASTLESKVPANDVRPPSEGALAMRTFTLQIPVPIADRLDAYCRKHDREVGSLLAELVSGFLDGQHDARLSSPAAALRILARWLRFQLARVLRAAYVPAAA